MARRARSHLALFLVLAVLGCTHRRELPALPLPSARFSPERFFAGETEGAGELKVLFSAPERIRVRSRGRVERDGTLVLRQSVEREGEAPLGREWRIRRDPDGRYGGTLSEAGGPVRGELRGGRLRLRYPMKGGLFVEQELTPDASGLILENRLTVRALGVPVARLRETIRKIR